MTCKNSSRHLAADMTTWPFINDIYMTSRNVYAILTYNIFGAWHGAYALNGLLTMLIVGLIYPERLLLNKASPTLLVVKQIPVRVSNQERLGASQGTHTTNFEGVSRRCTTGRGRAVFAAAVWHWWCSCGETTRQEIRPRVSLHRKPTERTYKNLERTEMIIGMPSARAQTGQKNSTA